ncbi:MAG: peptidoglycan DD-metalloendopeptidase family protein [Patescibacteria group bacterium]
MAVSHIRTIFVCALLLCALATAPQTLYAQSADAIKDQIEASNAQIQKLKDEISKLQVELNATSKQKQTLQTAVKELDLNIQKLTKSISLTQAQIAQKDKEINNLTGNISVTGGKIGDSQGQVADSLRQLGAMDNESTAILLLGGGTLSSFFDEAATLAALRQELQKHIYDLSKLKTNLETTKTETESKRKELAGLQRKLAQEKQGLTVARMAQSKLLAETQNKESSYQALIAQKQAEQAHFEKELFELSSGLNAADITTAPRPSHGILRWPLDNVFITQYFGRTSSSIRLYVSGTHNGMDFRALDGTPVRAALTGVVQEISQGAVANCQYGKWVLVRHFNGLTTLYAHLSSVNVVKGATVDTGDVVGLSGRTGYATGPHLHFTVYLSSAVVLQPYTCLSGKTVTIPNVPPNGYLDPLSYLPRF